ncbi:MAG TPA: nuclear transport factor 2 family protein [Cellvibrionaceae bacterium]|nr:nuclear transport factor 2 family protein [Cellvibrionaceae bacterium]
MLTIEFARNFAQHWVDAWNARNLEEILRHYHEDFVMSSPKIAAIAKEPSGVLHGKPAVAAYWAKTLALIPELKFAVIDVFVGADSVIVHYHSISGRVSEVFFFDDEGLVVKAAANYLPQE